MFVFHLQHIDMMIAHGGILLAFAFFLCLYNVRTFAQTLRNSDLVNAYLLKLMRACDISLQFEAR
jgi:hypothetical protein